MAWYLGSTQVSNIYFGSTEITNSYKGSTEAGGGYVPDRPYPTYEENVLADLSRVTKINNGGSLLITDVTSDGSEAVRFIPPVTDQRLAPIAVLGTAVNIGAKDSIVLETLPYANANVGSPAAARHAIELFSGASVSQTTNYHSTSGGAEPFDYRGLSTAPDASTPGRRQYYSAAVPAFTAVGTGATLTAVTGARHMGRGPTGAAWANDIFRVVHRPNPASKAKMIFAFDDALADQYTTAYPLMLAAGFPMTLYGGAWKNVADGVGGFLTLAQAREIRNVTGGTQKGQIAGQAWSTENPSGAGMSLQDLKDDLALMRAWGRANGFDDDMLDTSFFSSIGPANATYSAAITDGSFRTARAFLPGNASEPPMLHGETWPIGDPMQIRAISATARTEAQLTAHVLQGIANNGLIILVWHGSVYETGYATLPAMIALAQANSASIEVTTMRGALFGF